MIPREIIACQCEGEAWFMLDTPQYWRCQRCGITKKNIGRHGVERAQRLQCVVDNKAEKSWRYEEHFNSRLVTEFGVFVAAFCPDLILYFHTKIQFLPLEW